MNNEDAGYATMLASLLGSGPEADTSTFIPELTPVWPVNNLAAFSAELTAWIERSWDTTITIREWWSRLADAGLTMPTWPRSYGGISAPNAIQQLIEKHFAMAGLVGPPLGGEGLRLVGPALRQHAVPEQIERLLHPLMRGEHAWCVLLDEHDADLSDIETTAVVGDSRSFVINGGKVWVPAVVGAEWALVLTRTDPKEHVKRALTCFAVDLSLNGVSMTDKRARPRLVKLDGVETHRDNALGGIGLGWAVAQTIVAHGQSTLAGRIRRGLVDVAPGAAAGSLDRTVADVLEAHEQKRRQAPDAEPGNDRRRSRDLT